MALITFYNPASRYKWVNTAWMILLVLFPIFLWILPSDHFDHGGITLCPSKLFFDIECFGCGITRAVTHFHHFEFSEAIYFNQGVILVYPGLVVLWFTWLRKGWKRSESFGNKK